MEMHQVRYFLAVARTLNFTRAAKECHVSQPSLTRAVKLLEEELGGDLFRRERNLSHLTELGARMLPLLQQCYDSALSARSLAAEMRSGKVAALSVALSRTVGMQILVPYFSELVRALPGLELKFIRGDAAEIAQALRKGDADVAVAGPLGAEWDRLDSWVLFSEDASLIVPSRHRLAGSNSPVELAQLAGDRLLLRSYCEQAGELDRLLAARGVATGVSHRVASEADLATLITAGLGVAIAPKSTALPEGAKRIDLADLDLKRTVFAYAVAGRSRSPAATMLLKLLRAADWTPTSA